MISTKTGDLIYKSRRPKRLTIGDVADNTGVSKSMISLIETGKQFPKNPVFLKKVCLFLGINEDEMKRAVIDDFANKLLEEWE